MNKINMADPLMEASELLIELGLIKNICAKNGVFVDTDKVLEVMDKKQILNTYDAITDLYGLEANKILRVIKEVYDDQTTSEG